MKALRCLQLHSVSFCKLLVERVPNLMNGVPSTRHRLDLLHLHSLSTDTFGSYLFFSVCSCGYHRNIQPFTLCLNFLCSLIFFLPLFHSLHPTISVHVSSFIFRVRIMLMIPEDFQALRRSKALYSSIWIMYTFFFTRILILQQS